MTTKSIENLNKSRNPSTYDAMIDIETLDVSPTSIVVSIGYIIFKMEPTIKDSVKYTKRYNIQIEGQEALGLTRSVKTEKFWKRPQNKEAFENLQKDTIPLKTTLESLTKDLASIRIQNFWANSPNFDYVILENAYKACGIGCDQIPWKFYQLRDVRTVKWVSGQYFGHLKRNSEEDRKGILEFLDDISSHDPLFDCAMQIMDVIHLNNSMELRSKDKEEDEKEKKFLKCEHEPDVGNV